MTLLNYSKQRMGLFLGGSAVEYPTHFAIGTGSATVALSDTTLTTINQTVAFTTTTNATQKATWQGDINSSAMSGIDLTEFGLKSGAGTTGSMMSKEVIPALTFDGTNELRLEEVWEVF